MSPALLRACQRHSRLPASSPRPVPRSPVVALYFRTLLHRTPLYDAEVFPRTIVVYAGTLAAPDGAARAPLASGGSGAGPLGPYTVTDVDPATARATVLAVGRTSLASVSRAVATAAAQLQALGGYRHVPGGSHIANIAEARKDGILHWYLRDGHVYAAPSEAHPDLLPLQADVVASAQAGAGPVLVLGALNGEVAGAAASKGRLLAAHHAVWEAAGGAVASQWAGLSVAEAVAGPAVTLPRGSLVSQGRATVPLPLAPSRTAPAPSALLLVDPSVKAGPLAAADLATRLAATGGLGSGLATPKLTAALAARIEAAGAGLRIEAVPTTADAIRALGLTA